MQRTFSNSAIRPPAMADVKFKGMTFPPDVIVERSFDKNRQKLDMEKFQVKHFKDTPVGSEFWNRPEAPVSSYSSRGVFQNNASNVLGGKPMSRSNSERSVSQSLRGLAGDSSKSRMEKRYRFPLQAYSIQSYNTAYAKEEEQKVIDYFNNVFMELDEDGSCQISRGEFDRAFKRPDMQREFSKLGFQFHESPKLFKYLNKDLVNGLDIFEFVDGLREIVDNNNKNETPGKIVQDKPGQGPAPTSHVFRNCYCCDRNHDNWV